MSELVDRHRHEQLMYILHNLVGQEMEADGDYRRRLVNIRAAVAWAFYIDLRECGETPVSRRT